MYKVKILLVGPTESGKTTIANFLSDATENIGGVYRPTVGVRILEFDSQNLYVNGKTVRADIELWDTAGSAEYQTCFPAMQRDTHGVVFVYRADSPAQARALDGFHQAFAKNGGLPDSHCAVFANNLSNTDSRGIKLSTVFAKIPQLDVNLELEGQRLRTDFQTFLANVVSGVSSNRDQEEMNIMGSR